MYVVSGNKAKSEKAAFMAYRDCEKAQGVVEYAGALVIAAGIIAAGIIVVPPNFASFMNTVYTTMATYIAGQMPS